VNAITVLVAVSDRSFIQPRSPLPFLITNQKFLVPTRALNRALPQMRRNRTGSLLHLPRPNYYSAGCESPQMPSVRSKSVAGGLCFVLENCEVLLHPPVSTIHDTHRCHSERRQILQAVKSLAPRVKALSTSLCTPVSEGDAQEQARREELRQ
jgi:hypothetical protein